MAGYRAVEELRRLEADLANFGLKLARPINGNFGDDLASLIPIDADSLPIYRRDAEIFMGSLTEIRTWLRGVEWARQYDYLLRLTDDKKRIKKEDDERARQFIAKQKKLLDELKKDHTNDTKAK